MVYCYRKEIIILYERTIFMKGLLKVLIGICAAMAVLVIVKLVAEACEPCMQKYFEVEK